MGVDTQVIKSTTINQILNTDVELVVVSLIMFNVYLVTVLLTMKLVVI